MTPRWTDSSDKHQVPRDDQVYAIVHPTYSARVPDEEKGGGQVWLYIGHPHPQTDREIEVLVSVYQDGREAIIFHAMELGPKYRHYREEHPNG